MHDNQGYFSIKGWFLPLEVIFEDQLKFIWEMFNVKIK